MSTGLTSVTAVLARSPLREFPLPWPAGVTVHVPEVLVHLTLERYLEDLLW